MATKQQRDACAAVQAWCAKKKIKLVGKPRHVHARSYVIGHAAPLCLVVSQCWTESEPHLQDFDRKHPLNIVHKFDDSLRPGDWCITAYISTSSACEDIAIPIPVHK